MKDGPGPVTGPNVNATRILLIAGAWTLGSMATSHAWAGEAKTATTATTTAQPLTAKEAPCAGLSKVPQRSGPPPYEYGESLAYKLSIAGIYVGRMEAKAGRPRLEEGRMVRSFFGRARSNSIVSLFRSFAGRYLVLVEPDTLTPLGFRAESQEDKDRRWERASFSNGHKRVETNYRFRGKNGKRVYETDHPIVDVLTLMYKTRSFQLKPGEKYCQDIFVGRRLWRMWAEIEPPRRVKTILGRREVIPVAATFKRRPPSLDQEEEVPAGEDLRLLYPRRAPDSGGVLGPAQTLQRQGSVRRRLPSATTTTAGPFREPYPWTKPFFGASTPSPFRKASRCWGVCCPRVG